MKINLSGRYVQLLCWMEMCESTLSGERSQEMSENTFHSIKATSHERSIKLIALALLFGFLPLSLEVKMYECWASSAAQQFAMKVLLIFLGTKKKSKLSLKLPKKSKKGSRKRKRIDEKKEVFQVFESQISPRYWVLDLSSNMMLDEPELVNKIFQAFIELNTSRKMGKDACWINRKLTVKA
ncbi:CLUMA_CG007813, isoform A [Clunio marinus]|uniref:CLUMA_CG007813, isoform A n=1 Tax=Clunio marinus TaxID=568069 RepID=A0A1J1I3F2_9DIPT|nr:CLUMA_CG007813, isoform A [Clunio marinus]